MDPHQPGQLESERTNLAHERTLLATERTFLSWLRTGLTSIGLGIAIAKFIIFHTPEKQFIGHLMGQLLILWGICIFFFALIGFRRSYHKLAKSMPLRAKPYQYSFIGLTIVTTILIILSVLLFWIVVE